MNTTLRPRMRGFTLIELMVTLGLVAILLMVAVPSIATFQRNAQLTSFVNSLVAGINAARGEAMKRGRYAMVVPSDGANWSSGWTAFVDWDGSQTYTPATGDKTILTKEAAPSYLTISGTGSIVESPPYIMFDANGYAKTKAGGFGALTFSVVRNDVSSGNTDAETRRLIIASTGRVRACKPASDTTCTASASQ
jgi:type IV fimbrial biogenesis protein FimT